MMQDNDYAEKNLQNTGEQYMEMVKLDVNRSIQSPPTNSRTEKPARTLITTKEITEKASNNRSVEEFSPTNKEDIISFK